MKKQRKKSLYIVKLTKILTIKIVETQSFLALFHIFPLNSGIDCLFEFYAGKDEHVMT